MFSAIVRKIKAMAHNFSDNMGTAIDNGDKREIITGTISIVVTVFSCVVLVVGIVYFVTINAVFLFKWIATPVFIGWVLVYWLSPTEPDKSPEPILDPVDEELTRQRAREQYDEMLALMFNAMQGAANTTPLLRPHDTLQIESSSSRGAHFYLERGNVIFQFECDLETAIDKNTEDAIQRELQRYVVKQCSRYPMLVSNEAQGRAPVEVLDVKNLGGHVLVECCQTTSGSIPLIEARRRARVERQQRQQAITDQDYPE